MDDSQIIALYWARSEQAIRETDGKYGGFCRGVALRLLGSREDSEECVNDTYLRAWAAMPPQRPARLRAFLAAITRNLCLDRLRRAQAGKRGGGQWVSALEELAECVPASGGVEQAVEDRLLAESLDRFLARLPRETRIVFLRRYWYLCTVREIAASLGMGESKVKMLLLRTRGRLKAHLEQEGISL